MFSVKIVIKKAAKNGKSETLCKLSHAVFELEAQKGHLLWKVTDLVRKCKVSRALVYRYLGGSKGEILLTALNHFVTDFYGFDESQDSATLFSDRIREARQRLLINPEAILFYQKWRSKESPLQKEFISVELKFQKKLKKIYPDLNDGEILARHAVIHGVVTSPFLSPDQAAKIYSELFERKHAES